MSFADVRVIPTGTRAIRVRLLATRSVGASTDACFDGLDLTLTGLPACAVNCPAADADGVVGSSNRSPDLDMDGTVGLVDLSIFAQAFPPNPYDACADFDCDGVIGLTDVAIFAQHFGHTGAVGVCN